MSPGLHNVHQTSLVRLQHMASAPSGVEIGAGSPDVPGETNSTTRRRRRRAAVPQVYTERFIYVAGDGGPTVKVGSTCNLRRRLYALQYGSGRKRLRFLKVWTIGRARFGSAIVIEGAVHEALGRRGWTGTEWYALPAEFVIAKADRVISRLMRVWERRWAQRLPLFDDGPVSGKRRQYRPQVAEHRRSA